MLPHYNNRLLFLFHSIHFRGIPWVSKDRHIRIEAIGNYLFENSKYDVISMQEVWTENDYQLLKLTIENVFPYSHYFYR